MDNTIYSLIIKYIACYQKYRDLSDDLLYKATGVGAIQYDKEKVQSSTGNHDSRLADYTECNTAVKEAFAPVLNALSRSSIAKEYQDTFIDNIVKRRIDPIYISNIEVYISKQETFIRLVAEELMGKQILNCQKYLDT